MIVAVNDEYTRRQYLQACLGQPGIGPFLACRLQRYGSAALTPYRFYTCGRGGIAALMVCGGTATATPGFDPAELGSMLAFLGIERLLAPTGLPAPLGYRAAEPLALLQAGEAPAPAGRLSNGCELTLQPSLMPLARLLLQNEQGADSAALDNLYSELCTGRAHGDGMAAAVVQNGMPVAAACAPAVWQYMACISGVYTAPQARGKGLAGMAVNALVNALASQGATVALWCRQSVVPFYRANRFIQIGELNEFIQKG